MKCYWIIISDILIVYNLKLRNCHNITEILLKVALNTINQPEVDDMYTEGPQFLLVCNNCIYIVLTTLDFCFQVMFWDQFFFSSIFFFCNNFCISSIYIFFFFFGGGEGGGNFLRHACGCCVDIVSSIRIMTLYKDKSFIIISHPNE